MFVVLDHSYPFIIVIAVFNFFLNSLDRLLCHVLRYIRRGGILASRARTGSSLGFSLIFAVPDADTKISVQHNVNAKQ